MLWVWKNIHSVLLSFQEAANIMLWTEWFSKENGGLYLKILLAYRNVFFFPDASELKDIKQTNHLP